MSKNDNPFAIRKAPVELITAQAAKLEDYVQKYDPCGFMGRLDCNSINY